MDAINQPLLDVRDLSVAFGNTLAVDRVSFSIKRGECVALVGESGSGKSVSALSILKLLPYPSASHPSGHIRFRGRDLLTAAEGEMREIRGNDISIIFQEPMTSLNPLHTIEAQIGEILLLHSGVSGAVARARTLELLTQVGIPDPETRLKSYPHQLSGGQRQRVMIAMALANEPDLLDRGRADHRARRHGAGPDPGAAGGNSLPARHEHAVHHPRSRHRPPHRRRRLRDEFGRDRRAGAGRAGLHRAETCLYARAAGGRTQARSGAAAARSAGGDVGG